MQNIMQSCQPSQRKTQPTGTCHFVLIHHREQEAQSNRDTRHRKTHEQAARAPNLVQAPQKTQQHTNRTTHQRGNSHLHCKQRAVEPKTISSIACNMQQNIKTPKHHAVLAIPRTRKAIGAVMLKKAPTSDIGEIVNKAYNIKSVGTR